MPIITGKTNVAAIYEEAAKKKWVIPCFCTENLTTTEAILSAASEYAKENHIDKIPVTVAITVRYEHRSQASYYTNTRQWDIGLKLFYADVAALADYYDNVEILLHLDHVQYDLDEELLKSDLSSFSTIMYDASACPLEQNIALTKKFVEQRGKDILIEGACDEIIDAGGEAKNEITAPEKCEHYLRESGVDMVVANLGTEHRASGKDLKYMSHAASLIRDRIGHRIVLHGTSSVDSSQIANLFDDGICKVNIWTALERDSSPELLRFMVKNASKAGDPETVDELIAEGYLTERCATHEKAALSAFTTTARQEIIFHEMKRIVRDYFDMWYRM